MSSGTLRPISRRPITDQYTEASVTGLARTMPR